MGMMTPWGQADSQQKLAEGVWSVSTPGHGGILIGKAVARTLLSECAQAIGHSWGSWLAYEEDCDYAAVLYEHPEFIQGYVGGSPEIERVRQRCKECIERWNPQYFNDDEEKKV